jgi:Tfp pilus assembly protein PilF
MYIFSKLILLKIVIKRKEHRLRKSIFSIFGLFLLCIYIYPSVHGGIKGKIVGKDNNPINGVRVTIISMEYTTERYAMKTNKKGEFIQIGLTPGYYQVRCEKDGYMPLAKKIKVPISEIVEKEFILTLHEEVTLPKQIPGNKVSSKASKLFQQGNYEEAAKLYQDAIDKNPEDPIYYYNLGTTYIRLDKSEEAIEAFKKMLKIQPDSFLALKYLGELYGKKKDYEEASKYFVLAVKVSSNDPEAHYNLGVSLENMGDYPRALDAFQKSINCQEDYADSYYQLGLLYVNQNKLDGALAAFEKFIQLEPGDSKASTARNMIEFIKKQKK